MRSVEDKRIYHYKHINTVLPDQTGQLCSKYPFYKKQLQNLNALCKELTVAYAKEGDKVSYATTVKCSNMNKAIERIIRIANAVNMYNLETGNTKKQERLPTNFTDYSRPSHHHRLALFNKVIASAKAIKNIARYGISVNDFKEAVRAVNEYAKKSDAPAISKTNRAQCAKQCRQLLSEIHSLIELNIKPFFENIKTVHLDEYRSFQFILKPNTLGRPALTKIERKAVVRQSSLQTVEVI